MIVRLTERDAGPLPGSGTGTRPTGPVRAAGGSAIGRTLASSRAVAAPTPYRRSGDENDLLLDVHSVSPPPSSSDNQPARTAISTLTDRGASRFDRIQTAHPARYTI
jgi:hypothetical protein